MVSVHPWQPVGFAHYHIKQRQFYGHFDCPFFLPDANAG
jgi:hypothetical protein